MQASTVQAEIRQLESYRQQAFWWRTGAILVLVGVVGFSLYSLNAAVRGLAESGPTQDAFVAQLSEGMRKEVIPNIQTVAGQTLTEIQPQIREEFNKLNARVPELTDATIQEFQTLQTSLSKTSEKTLDESYKGLLTSREQKIRSMYPDVTEDQVKGLISNLTTAGETEIRNANDELFAPHQAALAGIMDHMETIRNSEAADTKGIDPNWEMGIAVLDVLRDDLRAQAPTATGSSTGTGNAANGATNSATNATNGATK
ncbi:MAG: hypothetical protein EOP88_18925 [Verrucomicrobiaceae bacterium]|nr:MAG: hypothetical protein EOP88_18925 [Verrucomicrobiaceae bacterium]